MDIQVGDRVTYRYETEQEVRSSIINDIDELKDYIGMASRKGEISSIELLKIERPTYAVIEEKKELLTEEEKEFLKTISKIKYDGISYIEKANRQLIVQGSMTYQTNYIITDKFNGLTENERYTLEELGIN